MDDLSNSTGAMNTTSNDVNDDDIIELPIVFSYLILLFRIFSMVFVTVINVAVSVVVIKKKDQFKGHHVLLIVNLMVSGIVSAVNATVQSSIMIISYIAGMDDPIRCDVLFATLSTFHVNALAFLMLGIDKFIAIAFPLRYISIIYVYIMISASWGIPVITSIIRFFTSESFKKSSRYGVCVPTEESFASLMANFIAPLFLSILGAFTVLACKLNKSLRQHDVEGLQDTSPPQHNSGSRLLNEITENNVKPRVAVLIALTSSFFLGFVFPLLYDIVQAVETNATFKFFVEHFVIPNAAYIFLITYSLIFTLYSKIIRVPLWGMIKPLLKMICPSCVRRCCHLKSATQRNQISAVLGIHTAEWTTSL